MPIRDPLTEELANPPVGAIRIAFWRHITASASDPEVLNLHRKRAAIVHELVDTSGLDVKSWGNVDAAHPAEVVEILVAVLAVPLAEAVIAKVVDYLWNRITERRPKREEGLMAVTLRRPDGVEIVWHFQKGV